MSLPTEKRCPGCKSVKPASEFYVRKGGKYLSSSCKACCVSSGKSWYKANKDLVNQRRSDQWHSLPEEERKARARATHIKAHGITVEDYDQMVEEQDGRCAICRELPPDGEVLQIDHDHSCCPGSTSCGKCVRKLLCSACNRGIGCFRDKVALLMKAVEYLDA